ncbi:hypothetical protein INT47_006910 [Mucor saturninus]|uniref:Uncharacterized protein n=1 Tax=Mucor saturninus TaxID=64648 RepID=A0A8H7USN4_9FUNG|nr:hypothetical protein INT47_006910 [Mucor saturninus]
MSEEQINYAALDAWVSLEIYNRFKSMPTVHQKVNNNTRAGSFVAIHLDSTAKSSAAAYGFLCADNTPDNNEIHNPTNINGALVVDVVKVQVPGFPVDCYASERIHFPAHGDTNNISESASPNRDGSNSQLSNNPNNQTSVNSRVLKDGFHLMDMIKLNKSHGMHKDFMRRFRDILYVCDQDYKALVEAYLSSIGTDWNTRMLIIPAWIFERVRKFVPPPDELHSALKFLFDSYGRLRCENSGRRLFNEAAIEMSLHALSTVQQGHVSDVVDGPPLYTEKGRDKNNLMRYKCSRGTSSVEGACHMNIVSRFASYNASDIDGFNFGRL